MIKPLKTDNTIYYPPPHYVLLLVTFSSLFLSPFCGFSDCPTKLLRHRKK